MRIVAVAEVEPAALAWCAVGAAIAAAAAAVVVDTVGHLGRSVCHWGRVVVGPCRLK